MEGTYSIYSGGQTIGTAQVSREGLYYRVQCLCRLHRKKPFKISVNCGNNKIILGTPVPEGESFALRTKIPVKRFGVGELTFAVISENEGTFEKFIEIRENEQFLHLKKLKNAFFQERNGVKGIVIIDR